MKRVLVDARTLRMYRDSGRLIQIVSKLGQGYLIEVSLFSF